MLRVTEIFKSIQGESTFAGEVFSFVRLAGCNLRCNYCDTEYAFDGGMKLGIEEIMGEVDSHGVKYLEVTGGEPLIQEDTPRLCSVALEKDYVVLIETNGSMDISVLDKRVIKIIDVKCPDSGSGDSFLINNLEILSKYDQLKFVLSSRGDFDWAVGFVNEKLRDVNSKVLFSPNTDELKPSMLAEWIVSDNLDVRLGLQIHKFIWDKNLRGV